MSWLTTALRRVRLRGFDAAAVQHGRAEAGGIDAKDNAERWQDYGFSAAPVDGQGLMLHIAGHTLVLRVDRLGERPALSSYEVMVWHKEGHSVTLKAGRVVDVDCDTLHVRASRGVVFDTPIVDIKRQARVNGKDIDGHDHGGVQNGAARTTKF